MDRESATQGRGRDLIALATPEFPKEFDLAAGETWPMVAAALVSRMIGTLESILDQQPKGREADPGSDVRRLLELALYLAWMAADPSEERIEAWRKADLKARLAADADTRAHGEPLFTDEQRVAMEIEMTRLKGDRVLLEVVSFEHPQPLGGPGPISRRSGRLGARHLGPTRRRVQLEGKHLGNGPYGIATVIFGLALFVGRRGT